jgi:hypothetical protein
MNTKDLIREGTGGTRVDTPETGKDRGTARRSRRGARGSLAFALRGVRRFERARSIYEPFRIY